MFPRHGQVLYQRIQDTAIQDQVYKPLIDEGKRIVNWQGLRSEESVNRSKHHNMTGLKLSLAITSTIFIALF